MIHFLWITLLLIWSAGCGSSGGTTPETDVKEPQECSVDGKNQFVYDVMHDSYLWADKVPTLLDWSQSRYAKPELLLEDLKYKTLDKWSYITTKEAYNSYFEEGKYRGFGFSYALMEDNQSAVIHYIYKNSPADLGGIKRGYQILAVNDINISTVVEKNLYEDVLGGESAVLKMKRYDGSLFEANLTKTSVAINSVLHQSIISTDKNKIGYMVFNSFIQPSLAELNTVFQNFDEANVTQMILDLRYNGGGRINVATDLATRIGGDKLYGKTMHYVTHNAKYRKFDYSENFGTRKPHDLNLSTLYVITTEDTCSASELVINALRASNTGMNVVTVGEATCGKPVGMYGHDFCDKHIAPIELNIQNSDHEGDYFAGIAPESSCIVSDDIGHDFGDTNESMLAQTIMRIEDGNCTKVPKSRALKLKTINPLIGFQREIGAI